MSIMSALSLEASIRLENSTISQANILYIQKVIDIYNLDWVPDIHGKGAYFLGYQIEKIINPKGRKFTSSWKKYVKEADYKHLGRKPSLKQLTGDSLLKFKSVYKNYIGNTKAVDTTRCLWITDYASLLIIFSKFNLERDLTTIEPSFLNLPNEVFPLYTYTNDKYLGDFINEKEVKKPLKIDAGKGLKVETEPLQYIERPNSTNYYTEAEIQEAFILLGSYTSTPFQRELTVLNNYRNNTNNTADTRRFDLVKLLEYSIEVFEIKPVQLTVEHITQTIASKAYYDLALDYFQNKEVYFYFVAPSISTEAKRLITPLSDITFLSFKDLTELLFKQIKDELPSEGRWLFHKRIYPKYSYLLDI